VIYQLQAGVWHYLAGTMWGTLVPDQRPTDLGANDAGFDFRGTDQQREFIWSGSVWVEVTAVQAGDVQIAYSSSNLTLTTGAAAIPGVSLVLNRAGRYLITGHFTFVILDAGIGMHGELVAGGATQGSGVLVTGNSVYAASSQQWIYQAASAGVQVYLQAYKDGGTAGSATVTPFTSITAQWIST
jgi:hypothetical protein